MPIKKKTKEEEAAEVPVGEIAHNLCTSLIARHGLRAAVAIVCDLRVLIEDAFRKQKQAHPEDWAQSSQSAAETQIKMPIISKMSE